MPKHPSKKPSNDRKKVKSRYQKAREDAQLLDLIPTAPGGACRDERVDPSTQSEPTFLELEAMAVAKGWPVPAEYRAKTIAVWRSILENRDEKNSVRMKAGQNLLAAYVASYRERHGDAPPAAGQTNIFMQVAELEREVRNGGGPLPTIEQLLGQSEEREAGTLRDSGAAPQGGGWTPRPLVAAPEPDDEVA